MLHSQKKLLHSQKEGVFSLTDLPKNVWDCLLSIGLGDGLIPALKCDV